MRVKLNLNIGSVDAKRLSLRETREGEVVTVSDEVGKELVKRGWGEQEGAREDTRTTSRPAPRAQ